MPLPRVLHVAPPHSSLSMERALHQILTILEDIEPKNDSEYDRVEASIDDVKTMLDHIE